MCKNRQNRQANHFNAPWKMFRRGTCICRGYAEIASRAESTWGRYVKNCREIDHEKQWSFNERGFRSLVQTSKQVQKTSNSTNDVDAPTGHRKAPVYKRHSNLRSFSEDTMPQTNNRNQSRTHQWMNNHQWVQMISSYLFWRGDQLLLSVAKNKNEHRAIARYLVTIRCGHIIYFCASFTHDS